MHKLMTWASPMCTRLGCSCYLSPGQPLIDLPPNSIDSWVSLEQKFHDYFYNGKVELRLSDLTSLRQKYTETISDYLRQFREVRNWCYNLTIAEKDLADPAFVGLTLYLRDKLDGQEFSNTNQLLQRALSYENHAKSSRFRDNANKDKEKHHVNFVDDEADDEEGSEICVAEWVAKPEDKPILCSFFKPNGGRREEMRYTLTCQSVIISLIYYFGEGLYGSPRDTSYLTPIFWQRRHIVSGTILILIPLMNAIIFGNRYNR
jgi:hypothetical protein